ncbi:hypothetical protein BJX76DRAFT_164769 [Aspergillus varians]
MTSHGVPRHGRFERLLKRHRSNTQESGGEDSTLDDDRAASPEKKAARAKIPYHEWVAVHGKRQQVSNLPAPAVPAAPIEEPSTTNSDDAPTTVTAVTTITTIVSDSTADEATEPAFEPASTTTNRPEAAVVVAETESDEQSTTELASAETPTAATESVTEPTTGILPTEVASSEASTEAPSESETDVLSGTGLLSEAVSDATEIFATLPSDIGSLVPSTDGIPQNSDLTSISPIPSKSVPIISHLSDSSNTKPTFIGSSLDISTAVTATRSSSGTGTQAIMGIASVYSLSSDTSTDSTITTTSLLSSITGTTTSTTTSTASDTSETSYSGSNSDSGTGWGDSGSGDGSGSSSSSGSTGGGSTSETAGISPDSNTSSDSGSDSGALSPQTTGKIVGGVVGGIAGASLIFLLILLLLRRRKNTGFFFGSPASRSIADDGGGSSIGGGGRGGLIGETARNEMASRDSPKSTIFNAAYLAPALMKRWRQSQMSTGEESFISTTPTSERGFQKISGRKLPSGMPPGFEHVGAAGNLETGSPTGSDFGPGPAPVIPRSQFSSHQAPPPSNPFSAPLDTRFTREAPEDDVVVMRPSPARTPTSGSANAAWAEANARALPVPIAFPMPPSGPVAIPKRPDALGRSHPSYDGSRGSRFTESI